MESFVLLNLIVNGFLLGGLFALMAYGLSISVGIMKVINIAHGDFIVLASYLSFVLTSYLNVDPLATIPLVAAMAWLLGLALQKYTVNRVLKFGSDQPVLLTFAISIILQNMLLLFFTADARSLIPPYLLTNINLGEIHISPRYLLGFVLSCIVFTIIYYFFKKTYLGRAMRAVPFDPEGARMLGIQSENVYNYASGLALAIAAVAGVMMGMSFTFYPDTGQTYVLLSFGVIVIGSLGSIRGTLLGGIIVGETLVLGGLLLGSRFQLMLVYLIILIILFLRPQGLFRRGD